jgi:hypothetical protein
VIIPSGANCSHEEKSPSGVKAAYAAVLPKPSFFKATATQIFFVFRQRGDKVAVNE